MSLATRLRHSWRRPPGRHSTRGGLPSAALPAPSAVGDIDAPEIPIAEVAAGPPTTPTVVLGFGDGTVLPLSAPAAVQFQAIAQALSSR